MSQCPNSVPVGMVYSTGTGAIVMSSLDLVIAVPTGGLALVILWPPTQLIWTSTGVTGHHTTMFVRTV